jgi:hypothetical protein
MNRHISNGRAIMYQLCGGEYTYGVVMYPQSVVDLCYVSESILRYEHRRIVVLLLDPLQQFPETPRHNLCS